MAAPPNPRSAVEALEAQARAQEAEGDWGGLLETLSTLATRLQELNDDSRARRALDQAYRIAETVTDQQVMAPALHQLGFLYFLQGGWDRALGLFHRALALHKEAGDRLGTAETLGAIAEALQGKGALRKALEAYEESLALKRALGDDRGLTLTWNNIGTIGARMGDLSGAMEAFERSLQIQESLGEMPGRAVTLANIGGIHLRRRSWQEALHSLEQALVLYEKAGDSIGMATTLNNLGLVQRRLGDLDGAYQRYARTRELVEASGDLLRATIPVHNMALIHEDKGEYREALRLMEEVVAIDKRIGHPDLRQDLETFKRIRAKLDLERDRRPSG